MSARGAENGLRSALYEGRVFHARRASRRAGEAVEHAFRHDVGLVYLDLDELDRVFAGRWFWSARRRGLVWFRRADFLGDPSVPLADAVRARVEVTLGRRPTGSIALLANLRTFGFNFNPVSFYYCHDAGGALDAIVAEITNTPWGERHAYVLDAQTAPRAADGTLRFAFRKEFHVSPFIGMDCDYTWSFSPPGPRITVRMENLRRGAVFFRAGLDLRRVPIRGVSLARALVRHPLMPLRVIVAIYVQALRLWWKRAPFHPHPRRRTPAGAAAPGPAAGARR